MDFLTSLALVFLSALALGAAARKLKLPPLIGMLLVGIALGPYVLNLLSPGLLGISADLRRGGAPRSGGGVGVPRGGRLSVPGRNAAERRGAIVLRAGVYSESDRTGSHRRHPAVGGAPVREPHPDLRGTRHPGDGAARGAPDRPDLQKAPHPDPAVSLTRRGVGRLSVRCRAGGCFWYVAIRSDLC